MTQQHKQSGFTLVELSIVLVIIGLIVGGVLAGRDMIAAAEIRSTISQMEAYNTAVNTFRDKFGGIPGDIPSNKATQFGFATRDGSAGQGDGNRLIQGCGNTAADGIIFGCETAVFWADLSSAQMIDRDYSTAIDGDQLTGLATPAAVTGGVLTDYIPEADIGQGNYMTIYSANGRNSLAIAGITDITAAGVYNSTATMTPQTAFNIDDKLDDGNPLRGVVTAITAVFNVADAAAAAAAGVCIEDTNNTYNTGSDLFANSPSCMLGVRTSF